jgi:hypothetical protein
LYSLLEKLNPVPGKHIELPPRVAQAFVRDMRAFFKAKDQLKRDEIASRQLHALIAFQRPRDKRLRLADVKEMFWEMKDHGGQAGEGRSGRYFRPDAIRKLRSIENELRSSYSLADD